MSHNDSVQSRADSRGVWPDEIPGQNGTDDFQPARSKFKVVRNNNNLITEEVINFLINKCSVQSTAMQKKQNRLLENLRQKTNHWNRETKFVYLNLVKIGILGIMFLNKRKSFPKTRKRGSQLKNKYYNIYIYKKGDIVLYANQTLIIRHFVLN